MDRCKFSKFSKKPDSKTGFVLVEGESDFGESVYLLNPIYIHNRSPKFSLVNSTGKHITGFYPTCGGALIGDHKKKAIVLFQRELGFDLFTLELPPAEAKKKLCNGELNDSFLKAREVW